jgi:LacI family transcriptional regulator/LacI family repressor for deo operon, udp, cdd, tsx, nupC, and nupG
MIRKAVSIQDIAQIAGVSHTTVSRALRDSPLIRAEVRAQIQQIADELGYVPNALAQSLRGQRTNTIGLVVTTIADPFVGQVVRGIEEVAQKFHYSVFLGESKNDVEGEVAVIENFHRRRVDGVIVAAALLDTPHEQRLARLGVPTVLINHAAESTIEQFHNISVDSYGGACQAVEHLLQLGHRKIGYLGAGNRLRSNFLRMQAYRDTLARAGIGFPETWVRVAPADRKYHSDDVCDGQAMLPVLVEAGVTAVFCYNDLLAVGALLACRELGVAVPEQISIIGFDDIELAQFVSPPLTTIHQSKLRMGQKAMDMLLGLMEDRPVSDQVLPTELVLRGTTAAFD